MGVSDTAALLEREFGLDEVEQDLTAARAGAGRFVLIEGPAGIGKSAVLAAVRARAQGMGMAVARARGAELEGEYAFGVVRQLFEPLVRGCSRDERTRLFGRGAGPARDALGMGSGEVTGGGERFPEVMRGLYSLALNLAEQRSLLVLVDDAHWADPPSVRFVSYLAGRLDGAPIVAVVAVRGDDPSGADGALGAVAREDTTRLVHLASLSPQATSAFLRSEYGEPVAPEFATACLVATGGNPFFCMS
jgi:predicted ATPase